MRRPGPDARVLLAALAGAAALLLLAHLLEPPLLTLDEAAAREGSRVAVEARVLDVAHGAHGRRIVLADDAARMPALAGPGEGPFPGDVVRATGTLVRLSDGPGLSLDGLEVRVPAATRALSPADVAARPELHEGTRVLVRGEARPDGTLAGGGARLRLAGLDAPGDGWWLAAGTLRYGTREAAYVLVVDAWSRPS